MLFFNNPHIGYSWVKQALYIDRKQRRDFHAHNTSYARNRKDVDDDNDTTLSFHSDWLRMQYVSDSRYND